MTLTYHKPRTNFTVGKPYRVLQVLCDGMYLVYNDNGEKEIAKRKSISVEYIG